MLELTDHNYQSVPSNLREEHIAIEWFETGRSLIKRNTSTGTPTQLSRRFAKYLQDGQIVYQNQELFVRIVIRPCVCMMLRTNDAVAIGSFCFDVGNRHLPIFSVDDNAFAVAYDARLYEALSSKFKGLISLEQAKLIPAKALHQF